VNLSAMQFRNPGLPLTVASALAESGLPPSRLELEITETVLLAETDANVAMLHALRALGVRIAMDDFGTGYSSLRYLHVFPFDKIKIDRSFTAALGVDAQSTAIVRAVTELGASLGITTVAEGVETHQQLQHLSGGACDEVQGFLLGRPQPAEATRALFRAPAEVRAA
jgi:EAL domain-containing protein (putative c-di-GMP-specific phosphodiesterase class I)